MTLLLTRVLTTTELNDFNFIATTVLYNFSNNFAALYKRSTNFDVFAVSNKKNFIKFYSCTSFNV